MSGGSWETPPSPPSHYRSLIPESQDDHDDDDDHFLSVRIVNADYYLNAPLPGVDASHSSFRHNSPVKQLPVIRVYGATPVGQKALLHVHGVFPYLYVPFEKDLKRRFLGGVGEGMDESALAAFLLQMAASVDKALNISMGRGHSSGDQHVFRIVVVSGKRFYGYHPEAEDFFKIYVYNPNDIKKMADLLLAGAILNHSFQPHEAHVPFILQFFIDYNLYGMNFLHLSSAKFRPFLEAEDSPYKQFAASLSQYNSQRCRPRGWWDSDNAKEFMLPQDSIVAKRHGHCQIEADASAIDILNRKELEQNADGENPGLAAIWEDEKQRRRNNLESSQISNDASRVEVSDPKRFSSKSEKFFMEKLYAKFEVERASSTQRRTSLDGSVMASQVLSHESTASPEDDAEDDPEPIVDEASILEVLSQSSRRRRGSEEAEKTLVGEESLVDLLAELVEEEEEEEEEGKEEEDDDADDVERETMEMSQIWIPDEEED